jgi:hypothetical protein
METLIAYFAMHPRNLFLVDGFGAALTAIMIGLVMPALPQLFIVPTSICYGLAAVAMLFALYSFVCAVLLHSSFRWYFLAIGVANLAYCIATACVVCIYFQQFTLYANLYFLLEIVVIISLVIIELKVVFNLNKVRP